MEEEVALIQLHFNRTRDIILEEITAFMTISISGAYLYCIILVCRDRDVRVIISMMVMCYKIIIEHDRRRTGLPNAPIVIEYDNNRNYRDIAI